MTPRARQPAVRPQEPLEGASGSPPADPAVPGPQTGAEGVASAERTLRTRLIAALRPRMTATEAQMIVENLLPEVVACIHEAAADALRAFADEHAALVGQIVSGAQDCLDVLTPPSTAPP